MRPIAKFQTAPHDRSSRSLHVRLHAMCSMFRLHRLPLASMIMLMSIVFVCGGATCAKQRRVPEFVPPVVFQKTPSLEELTAHLNKAQRIERLSCMTLSISMPSESVKLSGNLTWHRPDDFRLQAYPGVTRIMGDALDAGSNAESFWLLTKVPGEQHILYYASRSEFETQPGPRRILPVSPSWIREALGVIEFDPSLQHEGPIQLPDNLVEIRTTIPTPRGNYKRYVWIEPTRATIQQVMLEDPDRVVVAQAHLSEHQQYPSVEISLPHRVDLKLMSSDGQPMAFTLKAGSYTLNEIAGDESQRYMMPDSTGMTQVDLVRANATTGPLPTIPPELPTKSASTWTGPVYR